MGTKHRLSRFSARIAVVIAVIPFLLAFVAMIVLSGYQRRAAAFDLEKIGEVREQSTIYDANGEVLGTFGSENRTVVPLSAVSPHFLNALLAREDRRFRKHGGVDVGGVIRAMAANVKAGRTKQGASTITQQLAKNAFALEGRTFDRKILEACLARRIERKFSKDEILELYVNRIYFGAGFYGIEAAAQGYFGKPARDLNVGESAVLAGLIRSPSKLAPTRDAEAARRERDTVIDRMTETRALTAQEAAAAKATRVSVESARKRVTRDSVTDAVLQELEHTLSPDVLEAGGLKVYVTIDPQLQALAERVVDSNLTAFENRKGYSHPRKKDFIPAAEGAPEKPTDYLQGALVAIDNSTGAIRAAAGGRDYTHSQYSRALSSRRPLGSTFKPFVFAAAFDRGLLPGTLVDDSKIEKGELRDVAWSPENSDERYDGPQPAAVGLLKSKNTMTVRVGETAGLSRVRELGRQIGLSAEIPALPVIYLGAFESTLKDVTAAYTAFPNLGTMPTPHLIEKVVDAKGNTLLQAPSEQRRVLDSGSAWMVSSILEEVLKSGTAAKARQLGWKKPSGGKTGTTNDYFDAWFVGYTSSLTCGVWTGFDTPQTIGEKAYGSALALPIWVDFMKNVPEGKYAARPLPENPDLDEAKLCKVSGLRANPACTEQGCAYEGTLPSASIPIKTCETHATPTQNVAYEDTVPPPVPETPYVATSPSYPAPNAAPPTSTVTYINGSLQPTQAARPVPPAGAPVPPASATMARQPSAYARTAPASALPRPVRSVPVANSPSEELPFRPAQRTTVRTVPVETEVPVRAVAAPPSSRKKTIVIGNRPEPGQLAPVREEEDVRPGWNRARRPSNTVVDANGTVFEEPTEERVVPVRQEAPAAAAPETAVEPADAIQTETGGQPQRWVEKRGNRTITTTVVPVRRASPAEEDD